MPLLRSYGLRVVLCGCLLAVTSLPVCASASTQTKASSAHHKKKSRKKVSSKRGQQKIDTERARQIQEALIREHYLNGSPSGHWDDASEKAMQKFQADHGWQSKTTPDARALIQLGLGPDQKHLLNPESAMTTPSPAHVEPTAESTSTPKPQN